MKKISGISLSEQFEAAIKASEDSGEEEFLNSVRKEKEPDTSKSTKDFSQIVRTQEPQQELAETVNKEINYSSDRTSFIPEDRISISVENIKKVISIHDAYAKMDKGVKSTVVSFLKLDKPSYEEVILAVLNANESEARGLEDFVRIKKEEPVSRAFSLMSLDNASLERLNSLVQLFSTPSKYNQVNDLSNKVEYCRTLNTGLTNISDNSLGYLAPIADLLTKGRQ